MISPEGERRAVGVEGLTVEDASLGMGGRIEADGSATSAMKHLQPESTDLNQAIPSQLGNLN